MYNLYNAEKLISMCPADILTKNTKPFITSIYDQLIGSSTLVDFISCLMSSHREHLSFGVYKLWKMGVEHGAYQVWYTYILILYNAEKLISMCPADILTKNTKPFSAPMLITAQSNRCTLPIINKQNLVNLLEGHILQRGLGSYSNIK